MLLAFSIYSNILLDTLDRIKLAAFLPEHPDSSILPDTSFGMTIPALVTCYDAHHYWSQKLWLFALFLLCSLKTYYLSIKNCLRKTSSRSLDTTVFCLSILSKLIAYLLGLSCFWTREIYFKICLWHQS